jgi:cyanate permease
MLGVGMTGFALATLMMSLAARRGALLPNWLVVVGVVLAVVTLGSFIWFPGYAFLIWVLIVGIVVGIRADTTAARG